MTRLVVRRALTSTAFALMIGPSGLAAQSAPSTHPAIAATTLVATGIAKAKSERKMVFVDFGASWCGWCHRLDKFLADTSAAGRAMRDNFVIVPVVVLETAELAALNNPGSDSLRNAYRGTAPDDGLPFFAILDTAGKVVGTSNAMPDNSNIGHPDLDTEIEAFDRLLAKVAPRMTQTQRNDIRAYLRTMAAKK
jgi:thiol-disulfide isomerase/thioredoxin